MMVMGEVTSEAKRFVLTTPPLGNVKHLTPVFSKTSLSHLKRHNRKCRFWGAICWAGFLHIYLFYDLNMKMWDLSNEMVIQMPKK
jgi:hypothetical protein